MSAGEIAFALKPIKGGDIGRIIEHIELEPLDVPSEPPRKEPAPATTPAPERVGV